MGAQPNICVERCQSEVYKMLCECFPWNLNIANSDNNSLLCDALNCSKREIVSNQSRVCTQQCSEHNFCQKNLYRIDQNEGAFRQQGAPHGDLTVQIKQVQLFSN